jgi:hypothetical protein
VPDSPNRAHPTIPALTAVGLLAGLLAVLCLPGCGDDDDDTEARDPECACCDYATVICSSACDCDATAACSISYPGGDFHSFESYLLCFGYMSVYCRNEIDGPAAIDVCEASLFAPACQETESGVGLALPSPCL